jgi:hypothetical protein
MKRLNPLLAIVAGMLGGLVTHYITPASVHAQASAPKEVQAQSFVILDRDNNVVGTFRALRNLRDEASVVLVDPDGHEIWRAGRAAILPLGSR